MNKKPHFGGELKELPHQCLPDLIEGAYRSLWDQDLSHVLNAKGSFIW